MQTIDPQITRTNERIQTIIHYFKVSQERATRLIAGQDELNALAEDAKRSRAN